MNFSPFYRRDIKINEACLNNDDLKRLFSIIEIQSKKAVDIQIQSSNPDLFQDFEAAKEEIKNALIIHFNIRKKLGDEFSGFGTPNFDSSEFPERLESIFLSTKTSFENIAKFPPRNHIEMFLDFKRSRLSIDFVSMPSNPTENGSVVNVIGLEELWVIETYGKIKEFFDARSNHRSYIHKSGVYDLFLYVLVFPFFLYFLYRIEGAYSSLIDKAPKITMVAFYIYSFLFVNLLGRAVFQYARWLFPLVEYTSDRRWAPNAQRGILLALIMAIFAGTLYDIVKSAF
jgi:hypothetical protein